MQLHLCIIYLPNETLHLELQDYKILGKEIRHLDILHNLGKIT